MAARKVWVNADPYDHDLVCAALESGADAVMVPEGLTEQVKRLGLIGTVAPDGDLRLGEDVVEVTITDKASERQALEEGKRRIVIVHAADWTVIPLENLIAEGARLVARVFSAEEAILAATTMERGVEGVLLVTHDPAEIRRTVAALKSEAEHVELQPAQITEVRAVGMGDRVCVDTCSNMGLGEGMLVGNSSAAMFLVHAECVENPYVACRPFRVNAGAVHAYVRVPGDKTRYLSELESGDDALIVGADGSTRATTVGRAKTERRPLLLVRAQAGDAEVAAILQNAETIRLVRPGGASISVVELKPGDEILVALEAAGRHFGVKVSETIQEK
jgi:3-dehydroquinate synthase II